MSGNGSSFPFITVILVIETRAVVALVVAIAIIATIIVVKGETKSPIHINTYSNTPAVCYRV